MNMFKRLFKTEKVEEKFNHSENEDIIFNVDSFNDWFNDPNNNAVYAHEGIFLRLDKLSEGHIDDYLLKRYNLVSGSFLFSKPFITLKLDLYKAIRKDWSNKLNK